MSKCVGCGIKLQTNDINKPGYVPEIVLIESNESCYCKRCHDIIHHNKKYESVNDLKVYYDKISKIKNTKSLILLLIDVLDIYHGFIDNLADYIGDNKVIVLVNKIDLLPKSIKLHKIEEKVKELAEKQNLNIVKVMMISAKNPKHIEQVIKKVQEMKYHPHFKHRTFFDDCYVMGCASVGKSTFINTVCSFYIPNQKIQITTSEQFNTTIDVIKIPLDQKNFIIDTPGIVNHNSFGSYLEFESMKNLTPRTYLKPKTFQLSKGQTIFLGGLCQIDIVKADKISVSFYVSNDLYLHRTKTINASKILNEQITKLLVPPYLDTEYQRINHYKTYEYDLDNEENAKDLFISGIGFIHLVGNNATIEVKIDEKIAITLDESIL